jgi:hypothetical protein
MLDSFSSSEAELIEPKNLLKRLILLSGYFR